MKVLVYSFLLIFINPNSNGELNQSMTDSTFQIISYPEFEEMINTPSEKIRIYNFWATWCGPCVKEMPYFEKTQEEDNSIELNFISMDDGRKPERVTSFMKKKGIQAPVYLLNDVDYNKWIDKVDPSWSGAIPATLFIRSDGTKSFHEGEMTEDELKLIINQLK
ncbi:TlpA family protein disulfide reductase [Aquiflexum lacus]|uniref:TlpA family protein disulfide reductase n=1 Tax=Aquiflexum lacus TaxID=2483805 RepID=UPI001892FE90|nr:TlpA disulfide reductase family protein [Aquiflexum lacus]